VALALRDTKSFWGVDRHGRHGETDVVTTTTTKRTKKEFKTTFVILVNFVVDRGRRSFWISDRSRYVAA